MRRLLNAARLLLLGVTVLWALSCINIVVRLFTQPAFAAEHWLLATVALLTPALPYWAYRHLTERLQGK